MCGIVGLIQTNKPVDEHHVLLMRDSLTHRGPDSSGLYIDASRHASLAHRRLSIIDLSDFAAQPMTNEDRTLWIVYNGEVYNFPSLRNELERAGHRFQSNSDTEVILHAYEEWGTQCLQRLNGMFAFAIYDSRNQILFIGRDRLGIKPLYYHFKTGVFAFASELKALLIHPEIPADIDETAVYDYLTYHYIPAPKSVYKHIYKLPPASYLIFQQNKVRVESYWDLTYQPRMISSVDALQEVYRHVQNSVRGHLLSDVLPGVFLSGGIDSSAVSFFASQFQAAIDSFCADFDQKEKSEAIYAQTVADHLKTRHHTLLLTKNMFNRQLYEQYITLFDEPFADASGIPLFLVSQYARGHVKMALSGDGGDEVFAGYGKTYEKWFRTANRNSFQDLIGRAIFPLTQSLSSSLRGQPWLQYVCGDLFYRTSYIFGSTTGPRKHILLGSALKGFQKEYDDLWFFRQHWHSDMEPLHRILYLDMKTNLPDRMLVKADRSTMAASLELRVPLLDHNLVQAIFHLPPNIIYPEGRQKFLLRETLKNHLPESILKRPKKGFSIPLNEWMQNNSGEIERLFAGSVGVEMGWLNPAIRDINAFSHKHRLMGHSLWAMIVLENFFQKTYSGQHRASD